MSIHEVENIVNKLPERLRTEVQGSSLVVSAADADDVLRAAEAANLPDNKAVVGLYRCLRHLTTVVLRDQKRPAIRQRLGEPWAEMGFSKKDEEMADDLRQIIGSYVQLKGRILERQEAKEKAGAAVWAVPPEVSIEAKYRGALVALVEVIGEFDSSFGTRPHTVKEWSRCQVALEVILHEAGVPDAEIAGLFGRPDAAAVAQARYRRRVKAKQHNVEGRPS
jgi:hypothetical protein